MSKAGAGLLGFAAGSIAAVVVLLVGTEVVFQYHCSRLPPEDDLACFGPLMEVYLTRFIGLPLAVMFGGGVGCWLALAWRTGNSVEAVMPE